MSLKDKLRVATETFTRGIIDEIAAANIGELMDEERAQFEETRYFDIGSSYPTAMLSVKRAFIRDAFSTTNGKEYEVVDVDTGKVIVRRKRRGWAVRSARSNGYAVED